MINQDLRALLIHHWVARGLALDVQTISLASSDASFRRYFRIVTPERSLIVMDAPPERENIQPFIKVAAMLREAQVNVPEIHAFDLAKGLMLLEDFGNTSFFERLTGENAGIMYADALDSLFKVQMHTPINHYELLQYDAAFVERELAIFYEWFLAAFLNIEMPGQLKTTLNAILIDSALQQPQTCVHRDYHSRNLMYLDNNSPGVIDFQDAVIGPVSYDLVSLLKDCYIQWPADRVTEWRESYFQRLQQHGLVTCDSATFARWFDLMGLQRHLKAIGIFSRLHLRDGKSGYLKDIPRTLNYVSEVAEKYPELADFQQFLDQQLHPVYSKQHL